MNISINITYTSGTKVELIVPLEEPAQIVSEPELQPESGPESTPVQPAQDLADAFSAIKEAGRYENIFRPKGPSIKEMTEDIQRTYDTAPTFPSNAALDGETRSMYNMTYTTIDGKEWQVPPGLMKDLVIIYGEKTVEQELLKAHAWLEADPARRKTPRGMGRFLNGWLSRASSMVRTPIKTLLKRDSLMSTNGSTQESW
jgi:hypothetical protein